MYILFVIDAWSWCTNLYASIVISDVQICMPPLWTLMYKFVCLHCDHWCINLYHWLISYSYSVQILYEYLCKSITCGYSYNHRGENDVLRVKLMIYGAQFQVIFSMFLYKLHGCCQCKRNLIVIYQDQAIAQKYSQKQ